MSTIDYDPLDEEEAFTATSLNAGFTEIASGINAIDTDAVKRRSLRSEHQPSLTPAAEHSGITWSKELTNGGSIGVGSLMSHTTNTTIPGDLEVLFPSGITLGMDGTDRIGALLVLANVRVGRMQVDNRAETHNNIVVLTIQVATSPTAWHDVDRTRRSLSQPDKAHLTYSPAGATYDESSAALEFEESVDYDIPLRTLIDAGDLPTGSTIYGIRVVIRGAEAATGMPTSGGWIAELNATPPNAYYSVAQSNLSVIPFHALAVMN